MRIQPTCVQKYVFMSIEIYHCVLYMEDLHTNKNNMFNVFHMPESYKTTKIYTQKELV